MAGDEVEGAVSGEVGVGLVDDEHAAEAPGEVVEAVRARQRAAGAVGVGHERHGGVGAGEGVDRQVEVVVEGHLDDACALDEALRAVEGERRRGIGDSAVGARAGPRDHHDQVVAAVARKDPLLVDAQHARQRAAGPPRHRVGIQAKRLARQLVQHRHRLRAGRIRVLVRIQLDDSRPLVRLLARHVGFHRVDVVSEVGHTHRRPLRLGPAQQLPGGSATRIPVGPQAGENRFP